MTIDPITIESGAHVVHFYEDDADLIAAVGDYAAAAIGADSAALIIATPAHLDGMTAHLDEARVDLVEARRVGTLTTLDAAETLAEFYADGQVDADAFKFVIGDTVRDIIRRTGRAVQAHGEMVALLWDEGAVTAALELEDLWNDLSREVAFSLLCTYSTQSVAGGEQSAARRDICRAHSDVVDTRPGTERHFLARQPAAFDRPEFQGDLTALSDSALSPEVHQASGMIAVQLGVGTDDALQRIRSFAADHDRPLDDVAEDVVGRAFRLDHPDL